MDGDPSGVWRHSHTDRTDRQTLMDSLSSYCDSLIHHSPKIIRNCVPFGFERSSPPRFSAAPRLYRPIKSGGPHRRPPHPSTSFVSTCQRHGAARLLSRLHEAADEGRAVCRQAAAAAVLHPWKRCAEDIQFRSASINLLSASQSLSPRVLPSLSICTQPHFLSRNDLSLANDSSFAKRPLLGNNFSFLNVISSH